MLPDCAQRHPGLGALARKRCLPGFFAVLIFFVLVSSAADSPKSTSQETQLDINQFVALHFPRLAREHDDTLELVDVNAAVEDTSIQGRDAAVLVVVRRHMLGEGDERYLPLKDLLAVANDHEFQRSIEGTYRHLKSIDRDLFLPGDPDLSTFHQGRIGDCYLLATIAAIVHRNPQAIRIMIRPMKNGGFEVNFGNGQQVRVPALTDSELLLGAKMGSKHGIWLAVLEKACGLLRERKIARKTGAAIDPKTVVPSVELTTGGAPKTPIGLFTGHHGERLGGFGNTTKISQVHDLLTSVTEKNRLACALSRDESDLPPGITRRHAYAIFGYDSPSKHVKLFNPHGENFEPKGDPGWENGYPTEHGVFTLPLKDFFRIFHAVDYETNKPSRT